MGSRLTHFSNTAKPETADALCHMTEAFIRRIVEAVGRLSSGVTNARQP